MAERMYLMIIRDELMDQVGAAVERETGWGFLLLQLLSCSITTSTKALFFISPEILYSPLPLSRASSIAASYTFHIHAILFISS